MRTLQPLSLVVLLLFGPAYANDSDRATAAVGAAIYLNGQLGSGQPLSAARADAPPLTGEQAACVNCHRRSGLGMTEARNIIPPVAGEFLFHTRQPRGSDSDLPYVPGERLDREPYTNASLARAIRDGVDSEGHELSYLMPRFALNDSDMAALIAHLRSLERTQVPGVSSTELHFATIITPDADPVKRKAVLAVLQQFFLDFDAAPRGASAQTMTTSGNTAYAKKMFKVNRRWTLQVWEPTGPPATWQAQLDRKFAADPVFAVISGLGGSDWDPVARFCEAHAVPCLFPNVARPPANAERSFYSLYFSRGVMLEADLMAAQLSSGSAKRVLQVYRAGDVGEVAARSLAQQLAARGVSVAERVIPHDAPAKAVKNYLHGQVDARILWLDRADLAALADAPVPSSPLYLSGIMGGLEQVPLGPDWRNQAHLAYPVDLPERRRVRLDYALGWFRIRRIPTDALPEQVDTYLACGLLSETLKHMVDAFIPEYLLESLEDTVEHRILTGYYPRLALGPNQRFASKGGFVVHFDPTTPSRVVADGPWSAP